MRSLARAGLIDKPALGEIKGDHTVTVASAFRVKPRRQFLCCAHEVLRVLNVEKVIEKLAVTDKATLVCEKSPEGKVRVTSSSWDGEKVILKGQVLRVGNVDALARRSQNPPARHE